MIVVEKPNTRSIYLFNKCADMETDRIGHNDGWKLRNYSSLRETKTFGYYESLREITEASSVADRP